MEKEITKNRHATEQTLIKAVNDIIEESGFEGLGINAIAVEVDLTSDKKEFIGQVARMVAIAIL